MVSPNLIENPTQSSGPPVASVVPATLVVADTRADYPLTEAGLLAAVAALPSGGDIYVGVGNITLTAAVVVAKNIRIHGASRQGTTITIPAALPAFSLGAFSLTLEDIRFIGDNSTAQKVIDVTGAGVNAYISLNRVDVGAGLSTQGVRTILDLNSNVKTVFINDCHLYTQFLSAAAFLAEAAGGSTIRMTNSIALGWAAVSGNPAIFMVNSSIASLLAPVALGQSFIEGSTITTGGAQAVTFSGIVYIAASLISASTVTFSGVGGFIASSNIGNIVDASAGSLVMVGGSIPSTATFGSSTKLIGVTPNAAWTFTNAVGCVVQGCVGVVIIETGTSDFNHYTEISSTSTILGGSNTVEGSKRFGGTGNTADAYATVLTFLSLKGLLGIGTIKNTDGASDSMTVEEQVIDFFGVTHTVETIVPAADDYLLDPQTNFSALGGPPYSSYRVRVKSTLGGAPAPYSIQFAAQGVSA